MTGLTFDDIDVLGPVEGRVGMGYFDCFCVPSVSSTPPTPDNPNPASSRHCTSLLFQQKRHQEGRRRTLIVDYVGQSTRANYTLLSGTGWVGLVMEETVRDPKLGSLKAE
jgi:rhamnogalacturonan endolyase